MHRDSRKQSVIPRANCKILRSIISSVSYSDTTDAIRAWALKGESRYVCAANVHMIMEAYDDRSFQAVVNGADLVTPDGMPLVWCSRMLGVWEQQRVYGPTLTLHICEMAARSGIPIALYGGTEESLDDFKTFLEKKYPEILIACSISPPFRLLTDHEDAAFACRISNSGARILLVSIGCPKQEQWMAEHKGVIPAVMIGVGAAFDFHSGRIKQAPEVLQKYALEWLFRLFMEPKRLWKRYLKHNPRFVVFFLLQLLRHLFRKYFAVHAKN